MGWEHDVAISLEEIREQRDVLMRGRWVRGNPNRDGEGCQVRRAIRSSHTRLLLHSGIGSEVALRAILWAQAERFSYVHICSCTHCKEKPYHAMNSVVMGTNDSVYDSGQDAIDVLDRAEIILKECV